MQKINYQLFTDKLVKEIEKTNIKPSLLLHSCCGPCSSYCLEYLSKYFNISVLYYNPNIDTESEHNFRQEEQQKIIDSLGLNIKLITSTFSPTDFYNVTKGLEAVREGGERCDKCFYLRLENTAKYAKKYNFDYFTTTLSISPLKNSQKLNEIGLEIQNKYGVKYLQSDFKKHGGYLRSVELSKKFNMYRQDYCGCIYSKIERQNNAKNV